VRAPVDGQVMQLNVHLGEFAPTGVLQTPLILFGNVEPVYVRVNVDENEAWRVGAKAEAIGYLRGNKQIYTPLQFVRFEPYVLPKTSLTGDSTERVDTRVLQVIYSFHRSNLPIYVGQQMDVYIDAPAPGFEPPVCCRNFLREKPAINRYFEFPGVRKLKQVDRPLTHLLCT
jgi:HlyD family secretion protein